MSAQPIPMALRPIPQRKWIAWSLFSLCLMVAILILGTFGIHSYNNSRAEKLLEKAIAETDRLDPGWRLDDIEKQRRKVPNEENAASIVLAAQALMPPSPILPSAQLAAHE